MSNSTDATARPPLSEVGWVAREARAILAERVQPGSPRWEAYMARKVALLKSIEATSR